MDSIVDRVYDDMRRRILCGEFDINSVLVEQGIAAEYCVSRGTAREALQKLCQAKFLIKHPRKGYFLYKFSEKEFADLLYARYYMELGAARLVMDHCSDEQIAGLYQELEGEEYQYLPENTINNRFHMAIARLSGNEAICEMLINMLDISARPAVSVATSTAVRSHRAIVDALLTRKVENAAKALQQDIGSSVPF